MQKITALFSLLTLSTAFAQSIFPIKYQHDNDNNVITITGCTKTTPDIASCVGTIQNDKRDSSFRFYDSDFNAISPSGDEQTINGGTFKNQDAMSSNFFPIKPGIIYPIQMYFRGYKADSFKYLDIGTVDGVKRYENISLIPQTKPIAVSPRFDLGSSLVVIDKKTYQVKFTNCQSSDKKIIFCAANLTNAR